MDKNCEEAADNPMIGPCLPPHLLKKPSEGNPEKHEPNVENESMSIGPALPPHLLKKLPENFSGSDTETVESNTDILPTYIGPALPPHLLNRPKGDGEKLDDFIDEDLPMGPALPPHLKKASTSQVSDENEEEECEDVIGPLPPGISGTSSVQTELEERALQIKLNSLSGKKENTTDREVWMLELPQVKPADSRFGARQFRTKPTYDGSKDRSVWTETPAQKEKRLKEGRKEQVDLKEEAQLIAVRTKNDEQEQILKTHKRKSSKSLLEIHSDDMKKKKDDKASGERRPFNREIDLKVNHFDEAQKKAVLKKAQLLDDRFSSGQSKFL